MGISGGNDGEKARGMEKCVRTVWVQGWLGTRTGGNERGWVQGRVHPPASLLPRSFQQCPTRSYFHRQSIHFRPALQSRSPQQRSPQTISTLHSPSTFVRHFHCSPSRGAPPELISMLHGTFVWRFDLAQTGAYGPVLNLSLTGPCAP